ncbi:MAG: shikimate kinase [Cytophagales bacterium]|nr:shikimate kinase [Bernardetiaceae bacterium]MDW8203922.1 shikimate kinase [Cytophagales bacterium]
MIPSRIYLVGMPGCGKTTLGKLLASRMAYHFVDLDELIAEQEQMSIADLFAQKGEPYFREKEKEALHRTFKMTRTVVATGGGTPCFYDNMEQINKHGLAVFINIPLSIIAGRIERQQQQRPLLTAQSVEDILTQLKELYQQRFPYYDQAEVAVSGTELNADYIYNKIHQYISANQ